MEAVSPALITIGIISVLLAAFLATRKNAVSAAMILITLFINLAAMYGLLDAHFSAIAQIIVYAGAIMVVFLFVIMLLNIPEEETPYGKLTPMEMIIIGMTLLFSLSLGTHFGNSFIESYFGSPFSDKLPIYQNSENLKTVAGLMLTNYIWAFELISLLILGACIGAVVISKKKRGAHQDAY